MTESHKRTTDGGARTAFLDTPDEAVFPAVSSWSISAAVRRGLPQAEPDWRIRNILVPTDFSHDSTKALKPAIALAKKCDASLTILNVIDINAQGSPGTAQDMMRRLWAESSAQMTRLASCLSGDGNAQTIIAEGLPWEVIIERSRKFDLLVMAKTPRKKAWELFSQHTLRRVIEKASCPVIVVRE